VTWREAVRTREGTENDKTAALLQVADDARQRFSSATTEEKRQFLQALASSLTGIDRISGWLPSKAAFAHWLTTAGFSDPQLDVTVEYAPDRDEFNEKGVRMNTPMVLRLGHARG
jgi:hypothetical protein